MPKKSVLGATLRTSLLVAVIGYYAQKYLDVGSYFFPHGYPVDIPMTGRLTWSLVDDKNDSLQGKHGKLKKIVERVTQGDKPILKGPETIVVDNSGTIYAITRGANLVRLDDFQPSSYDPTTLTARATIAKDLGNGAPLGGSFTADGETLYVADAVLGLIRIKNFHKDPYSKIELVANKVMDNGVLTRIVYADDVKVGPKTGRVYFSDATDIPVCRIGEGSGWDVMYASKVACIRGSKKGRLLQYNPETEEVTVLAHGFWFANGVAVDKDETYILVSDTFSMQVSKYHLSGPKKGTLEPMIQSHQLTGFTDGADCSWASEGPSAGKCYVAVPSEIMPAVKALQKIPPPYDIYLRALLLLLPKWLAPEPTSYGCFVEIDMESGELRILQDPDAQDMRLVTGVTVYENKVYLGSLAQAVVGVYDLA